MDAPATQLELERHLEGQRRAQERQLVAVRLALIGLAAVLVFGFRDQLPELPLLLGLLAVVGVYNLAVPWLLRHFPSREVGIVTTGVDMAAVTVVVYVFPAALDTYLFYSLVILGVALRFGLGASVWAAAVVSGMYLAVVVAGTPAAAPVRELLPVRIAYLLAFGVVAGLFSRLIIARADENARLQQRLDEDERERERVRERELLSRLGRDFGASLERQATVSAIVEGAAPLLGDATLLCLLNVETQRLEPAGASGPDADLAAQLRAFAAERTPRVGEGAAGGAAATATTVVLGRAEGGSMRGTADPDGLATLKLGWLLAAPILAGGRVLGVLVSAGRPPADGPGEAQHRLAEAIAERAGPALQNAVLWADLQEQVAREQQAQRIKDDFLSIVSHELRTPLTSIQGYSQLLEGRLRGASTESKEMAHLRVIRSQVGRMRRLVDDLLDVSRIDRRGAVSIEPVDFDLTELLREAVARTTREHRDRRVDLDAPDELPVRADRDRIDQVVTNLLENAVKYSPERGPIAVSGAGLGREVEVRVADTGVGIAAEHRDNVFERFYQADGDTSRRRFGGLGLGLYISRAILDAHGGRIWAEPNLEAGRGTVFTFRMPRLAAPPPTSRLPPRGEPPPFVVRRDPSG